MIKIDFPEPTDASWVKWRKKCKSKTAELIAAVAASEEFDIIERLYKQQKRVYFDPQGPFYGKCAFCELPIIGQPGDVEHFRPKKKVTDENRKPVLMTDADGCQREHPGYYWLAYDWTNLLPACRNCNSPGHNRSGKLFGKCNCFPVEGRHAWKPGDESSELPLLINPVIDDPADHLEIDDLGILLPRKGSNRGKMCIRIFGLNEREELLEARYERYREARNKMIQFAEALHHRNTQEQTTLDRDISDIRVGKSPFSIAGRRALREETKLFKQFRDMLDADNGAH